MAHEARAIIRGKIQETNHGREILFGILVTLR